MSIDLRKLADNISLRTKKTNDDLKYVNHHFSNRNLKKLGIIKRTKYFFKGLAMQSRIGTRNLRRKYLWK